MELEHTFTIPVTVEKAWPILLDIEQIAPCMPGAAIESVDGDDFAGSVKVKLGPINLTYKGQAKFVEKNDESHTAVIDARGRDSRGNGTASAKITAGLVAAGDSTTVKVVTDLNITGKPAQFGRGVMADVGNKLIGQFADCLAGKLSEDSSDAAGAAPAGSADATDEAGRHALRESAGTAGTASAAPSGDAAPVKETETPTLGSASTPAAPPVPKPAPKPVRQAVPEPIDLLELAGGSVAKRVIPVIGVLLAILGIIFLVRKRNK